MPSSWCDNENRPQGIATSLDIFFQPCRFSGGTVEKKNPFTGADVVLVLPLPRTLRIMRHLLSIDDQQTHQYRALFRDLFNNPFRPVTINPSCLTPSVVALAQTIYELRSFDRLPELAQALEDTGCDDANLFAHLRSRGPHTKGCWAVDLVLGKS